VKHIREANADIVALEELNHFDEVLAALPEYTGVFQPKTSSPTQALGFPVDGVAILYRRSTLRQLRLRKIAYPGLVGSKVSAQVGLVAVLSDGAHAVVVAATHLKAKRSVEFERLRVHQMTFLLRAAAEEAAAAVPGCVLPVVVLGDFNSNPFDDVHVLMRSHMHGGVPLYSCYQQACGGEEPPYTTWKKRTGGEACYTGDYIWCSATLRVRAGRSVFSLGVACVCACMCLFDCLFVC
jgi:endonuclease/exonuclease/phosphatase family metal-dependent hydrolase